MLWLGLWSLPIVSNVLVGYVESQQPVVAILKLPRASAIVILGGGMTGTRWPADIEQPADLGLAADRVWYGAKLFHAGKAPVIIVSGGRFLGQGMSEPEAMELFLLDLGVPQSAIVQESRSRTTTENARYTAKLLRSFGKKSILLVTSASHMQRARQHFDKEGLRVIPAATDYLSARITNDYCCLPSADALHASGMMFKELLARAVM